MRRGNLDHNYCLSSRQSRDRENARDDGNRFVVARAPSEWPFFAYSNIPYSFSFIFEYRIYSNMGNSLQNEPYWSKIDWELAKLRQNMPVQSQYASMISILLSRIGARTGNIKTKLLIHHHMRYEGMATYSFRFLTSYSNIRILLRLKNIQILNFIHIHWRL